MKPDLHAARDFIGRLLRQSLERGARVDIDGLGVFLPKKNNRFRFVPQTKARVFLAYVEEDIESAKKLYCAFRTEGIDAWLDKKKLLPGQNWPRSIEAAIQSSDFFMACFSRRSVSKRGSFHSELRYALECAARVPLDEIFFIPLRLDDCIVPPHISSHIQYVDMFPDWDAGFSKVLRTLLDQEANRKRKQLPLAG